MTLEIKRVENGFIVFEREYDGYDEPRHQRRRCWVFNYLSDLTAFLENLNAIRREQEYARGK